MGFIAFNLLIYFFHFICDFCLYLKVENEIIGSRSRKYSEDKNGFVGDLNELYILRQKNQLIQLINFLVIKFNSTIIKGILKFIKSNYI